MVADWLKDIAPVSSNNWALVFVLHVATTMFIVGQIWLVQIVHYPLFAHVGDNTFLVYHKRYTQWISSASHATGTGHRTFVMAHGSTSPLLDIKYDGYSCHMGFYRFLASALTQTITPC
ncbi:MAG: hypothetical protein OEU57_10515 [Desulfuromonadales bacterium]|nr:hypothetical protein [Desulfuromonadales bacterium]